MKIELESDDFDAKPIVGGMSVSDMREELDGYFEIMESFTMRHPTQNLMDLAAFTARVSFMRTVLVRKPEDRTVQNFRTKEIDPFLTECDRQFKIWSRLITATQFEWEMNR